MPYEAPPGDPHALTLYGEQGAPNAPHEQQTVQTWYTRLEIDATTFAEVTSPLILSGGCTSLLFTVVSFFTLNPAGFVQVFALPVGWTGPTAGQFWVDPFLLYYYLAVGAFTFAVGQSFTYGFVSPVPPARPPGQFALRFVPDDQYPWSVVLDVIGCVPRPEL